MKRDIIKYVLWSVGVTFWAVVCFILPDFLDSPIHNTRTFFTVLVYLVALGGASFWIIYLIGLNKYVTWVCLPVFGLVGAGVSFYRFAFHATITPMIIDATLHTNGGTIAGVISWQLIGWLAVNIGIVVCFILWRNRLRNLSYSWVHAIVVTALLLLYYHANDRLQMSINQRYPYNIVHSFIEYHKQQQQLCQERKTLPYTVMPETDSLTVVFVLGEALRADHVQLNGYARATTPLLAARSNVVSLPHIYSEYTYTSTSVPFILSPADSLHPDRKATHHSFIHIFKECGYQSAWLSNQDNGRTYVAFMHEADTIIFPNASKSVFVFDPWYDEQLLPPLDELLTKNAPKQLYILHTIGSHWYYNLHVPEQYQSFQPVTTNRIITNNSEEQIINSYDNTVLYLDVFLDSLIQRFEQRNAVMIYISDHGEALGEGGNYLHAGDNDALHLPACMIWYSDKYAALFPEKVQALRSNKEKRYRTDCIYYSVLSAAGIESENSGGNVNIFMQ